MKIVTKFFAVIGFIYTCVFVWFNIGFLFLAEERELSLITGEHECEEDVISQSRGESIEAKYIIFDCDEDIIRNVEVTKYLGEEMLERHHFLVELKETREKEYGEIYFATFSDNNKVIIIHSENVIIPAFEHGAKTQVFDYFTVSVSDLIDE